MSKGRVGHSSQHGGAEGIGATPRNAYSVSDRAADRRMRDLIDRMKAIEARPRSSAD